MFHYNLPKSLENHTQEIGRAGRDGLPAICELLACGDDLTVLENFIYGDTPTARALGNLLDRVLRLGPVFDVSPYDLATACDIRPGVVATVMSYLEIDGIIEATGSHYDIYRAKLITAPDQILAGRPAAERKLIRQILAAGETNRGRIRIQPSLLEETLRVSRARIVATLNHLHAAGEITFAVSGVRHGYKLKKDPGKLAELTEMLACKFEAREQADLARLGQVLGLAAHRGCLTGYLTRHFGETLGEPCGHCDRCRGVPATPIGRPRARRPGDGELTVVRDLAAANHAALGSPRQLARFLCGLASPATTRARLTGHEAFGLLADLPFAEVLAIATAAC